MFRIFIEEVEKIQIQPTSLHDLFEFELLLHAINLSRDLSHLPVLHVRSRRRRHHHDRFSVIKYDEQETHVHACDHAWVAMERKQRKWAYFFFVYFFIKIT